MNRLTLAERIVIECGIYQKLKLSQIAKKIGKTPGSVSREIRLNRTFALGEHPCGKDCCFAGECKTKSLCGVKECSKRCVACREYDCRDLCSRYNNTPCSILLKPPYVVIPVFAEESAKQIGHTILHSKPMQWQNVDIQIPEAKYKQEVKNSKNLINWFHR